MTAPLDVDVWVWDLDADPAADALDALSADERARAARFVQARDQRRFAAGRARLRSILARLVGAAPADLAFHYGANGKPALGSAVAGDLAFNLSHTHDLALLAVTRGADIGADVERVRPVEEDVAERFFSEPERRALAALPAADQTPGFHRCWTRKEAFVKALGEGLSIPLHSFAVSVDVEDAPRLLWQADDAEAPRRWAFAHLAPRDDVVGAVAVRVADRALNVRFRTD